jgi:hypothetical protein
MRTDTTNGQMGFVKVVGAFREYANAPKNGTENSEFVIEGNYRLF